MEQELKTAWDRQMLIRDKNRPTIRDYLPLIFHDFYELHGDRGVGDDGAILGGIGFLKDVPVTVLAEVKGRNIQENKAANFATPGGIPEGTASGEAGRKIPSADHLFHRHTRCILRRGS